MRYTIYWYDVLFALYVQLLLAIARDCQVYAPFYTKCDNFNFPYYV